MTVSSRTLLHPQSGKKLLVYVDGRRVQLIRMPVQHDASQSTTEVVELSSEREAQATADRFIEAQLCKGYVDAEQETGPLAEALAAVDDRTLEVHDALAWLEARGTREDVDAFVDRKAQALFGALGEHVGLEIRDLEWRDGRLAGATLLQDSEHSPSLDALTEAFLRLAACTRVNRLRFGVPGYSKPAALDDFSATFAAVAAAPGAQAIESLAFDFRYDDDTPPLETIRIGDLSAADGWTRLSSLRTLSLRGQGMKLEGATVPRLEALRWESAVWRAKDFKELGSARWPSLRRLVLEGAPLGDAEAKRLLAALDGMPALETLKMDLARVREGTRSALARWTTTAR